jgi:ATP-binding cassette, subfamily B, bacterial
MEEKQPIMTQNDSSRDEAARVTTASTDRVLPRPKWRERLRAIGNIPPILKMVYEAAPQVVAWSLVVRVAVAAIPVSMLAVTRVIIDAIDRFTTHRAPLAGYFWWLVALEFGLAGLSTVFARLIEFFDAALAARYAHHVSVRTMEHAALLDLSCYEDPAVYDKLERARVQGTDRIVMIQSAGRWVQQVITTATLAASIFFFSP